MVQYFIDGGGFMWPILISLIFGLGFAFERAYSLIMSSIDSDKFFTDVSEALGGSTRGSCSSCPWTAAGSSILADEQRTQRGVGGQKVSPDSGL